MAALRIALQTLPQLPQDLEVITDVDIDLELAPADQPACPGDLMPSSYGALPGSAYGSGRSDRWHAT